MSQCLAFGKDRIILVTKEDHGTPSKIELPAPDENDQRRGLVLPNGELNWSCSCLGFMPYGPCGYEFREAFNCIHNAEAEVSKSGKPNSTSQTDPSGLTTADELKERNARMRAEQCYPKFKAMKECFAKFPKLYPPDDDED